MRNTYQLKLRLLFLLQSYFYFYFGAACCISSYFSAQAQLFLSLPNNLTAAAERIFPISTNIYKIYIAILYRIKADLKSKLIFTILSCFLSFVFFSYKSFLLNFLNEICTGIYIHNINITNETVIPAVVPKKFLKMAPV